MGGGDSGDYAAAILLGRLGDEGLVLRWNCVVLEDGHDALRQDRVLKRSRTTGYLNVGGLGMSFGYVWFRQAFETLKSKHETVTRVGTSESG